MHVAEHLEGMLALQQSHHWIVGEPGASDHPFAGGRVWRG